MFYSYTTYYHIKIALSSQYGPDQRVRWCFSEPDFTQERIKSPSQDCCNTNDKVVAANTIQ